MLSNCFVLGERIDTRTFSLTIDLRKTYGIDYSTSVQLNLSCTYLLMLISLDDRDVTEDNDVIFLDILLLNIWEMYIDSYKTTSINTVIRHQRKYSTHLIKKYNSIDGIVFSKNIFLLSSKTIDFLHPEKFNYFPSMKWDSLSFPHRWSFQFLNTNPRRQTPSIDQNIFLLAMKKRRVSIDFVAFIYPRALDDPMQNICWSSQIFRLLDRQESTWISNVRFLFSWPQLVSWILLRSFIVTSMIQQILIQRLINAFIRFFFPSVSFQQSKRMKNFRFFSLFSINDDKFFSHWTIESGRRNHRTVKSTSLHLLSNCCVRFIFLCCCRFPTDSFNFLFATTIDQRLEWDPRRYVFLLVFRQRSSAAFLICLDKIIAAGLALISMLIYLIETMARARNRRT